jgi:hypothetical protein
MLGPKEQQAAGVPQNSLEEKLRRRMTTDHQVGRRGTLMQQRTGLLQHAFMQQHVM